MTKDEELRKELEDTADKKPYENILDFAERQLGEFPKEEWDLSTKEGLKSFEDRCSRRVYKSTGCGAWLVFLSEPDYDKVRREFRVCVAEQDGKTVVTQVREGDELLGEDQWPEELKLYLALKPYPGCENGFEGLEKMTLSSLESESNIDALLQEAWMDGHTFERVSPTTGVLKVWVRVDVPKQTSALFGVYGIRIGSIVEGSDAEVEGGAWYFPFTEQQYEDAIAEVEAECDRLWDEANDPEGDEEDEDSDLEDTGCVDCGKLCDGAERCASCAADLKEEAEESDEQAPT